MIRSTFTALLAATPAWAEPPVVLADTAPVHSLVATVMNGMAEPALIVPPGTSPHDASLRPSEARALADADVIVWTGDALLPWLGEGIVSLAPQATVLSLLETEGWDAMPMAEADDGHEHGHDHGDTDPHAWLDPAVAAAWLPAIAEALAQADPENADAYRANAASGAKDLSALAEGIADRLESHRGTSIAVGHDAYRYFARAAGLGEPKAIAAADGADPSPTDIAALREAVATGEVGCLLLDAESDPSWADTLGEGAALSVATVDPDGVTLEPGPELYLTLVDNMVDALESCLAE